MRPVADAPAVGTRLAVFESGTHDDVYRGGVVVKRVFKLYFETVSERRGIEKWSRKGSDGTIFHRITSSHGRFFLRPWKDQYAETARRQAIVALLARAFDRESMRKQAAELSSAQLMKIGDKMFGEGWTKSLSSK